MVESARVTLDFASKTLTISVRELVEFGSATHRAFGRENWWIRLGLGTEVHSRLMDKRRGQFPGYQSEVWVEGLIPFKGWSVKLQGRADGFFQEGTNWVVEEYKTCQGFPSKPSQRHQFQLLVYTYLLERNGTLNLLPRLVYCGVEDEAEKSFSIPYEFAVAEAELLAALEKVLKEAESLEKSRQEKVWAALSLPFPHRALRPGQEVLVQSVEENLKWKGTLLAQAPTGIGKTAATLFASVKTALAEDKRIFFLTSKTLQQEIAVKTLVSLNSSGAFKTAQIASKEKMCANDRIICHEVACPYAKDFALKMEQSKITERFATKNSHFDPREIFEQSKKEQVCPFEVQLELCHKADAIVADYNYVFEPSAALSIFAEEEQTAYLVIDEAHNLVDRIREIYSPTLTLRSVQLAGAELATFPRGDEVNLLLSQIGELIISLTKERPLEVIPPTELSTLWPRWEKLMLSYFNWKSEQETFVENDSLLDFHFTFARWMLVMRSFDSGFTCIAEKAAGVPQLSLRCLDAAKVARKTFARSAGSVLLSATLAPFQLTSRALGINEPSEVEVPSPFPAHKRKILIYPEISTTYQSRPKCYSQVADLIKRVQDSHTGRTLVLFPSYEFLRCTLELLPGHDILVQQSGANHREQLRLFRDLATRPSGLLFAVLGGMFAEGLDYPDNLLNGVVVISPGLPQISLQRELLRNYYEQECGDGFLYAYLQPGMTKVIQAAGRLIRSEKDRGFILLVCSRFLQTRYTDLLPHSWHNGAPHSLVTHEPAEEIRQFFANQQPAFAKSSV